ELQREKEVIYEEINSYKDSPSELIFDDFEEMVFHGHPIARNILGTRKNLMQFNREAIFRFIENNYHTDQMVIGSVGKIDFRHLVTLAEKYFGTAKTRCREIKRKRFDDYVPGTKVMQKDTFQSHCVMGNLAFDFAHPKRIPMILLNNIIGGQAMNSRLNLALREKKGMAYNIESGYTAYSDTGLFSVYFGTDHENLDKATELVLKEFKRLREQKLGIMQLRKAQKQLIGQIAISTEHREDLMLAIAKSYLIYNKVDPLRVIFQKIEAVTAEDLMDVANIVLDEKQISRLIYR
ncbi:MAG: M16 family metallopeptidase, partial [Prolixibacteraceae bacterium]